MSRILDHNETEDNEILRSKSDKIAKITDEIRDVADEMIESTLVWEKFHPKEHGVAMAAVQIGLLVKLVIVREEGVDGYTDQFKVLVNPEIIDKSAKVDQDHEGCLSVPNKYGKVWRSTEVTVTATSLDGKQIKIRARGFEARLYQHEIDHLDGILFIDHMQDDEFKTV